MDIYCFCLVDLKLQMDIRKQNFIGISYFANLCLPVMPLSAENDERAKQKLHSWSV